MRDKLDSLAELEIPLPVHRDITASLLDFIDDMSLVRHIPLSERYHILQVIRQEFPANVDALNMFPDDLAIFDWDDVA